MGLQKVKKGWKNGVSFLSANRTPAVLGTYRPWKWTKLCGKIVHTKIPLAGEKMDKKSILKVPGAVSFILAFIAVSEA